MVHYILYGQESGKWTKVYLACHSSEVGDVVIEKRGETPETFQVYVLKQIGAGSSGVVPASWAAQVHGEKKTRPLQGGLAVVRTSKPSCQHGFVNSSRWLFA